MDERLKIIAKSLGTERVRFDEDLSLYIYSNPKIKARCFYVATNNQELVRILDLAFELKIPFSILGAGTKFISQEGLKELVIKNRTSNIKLAGIKGKVGKEGIGVKEALVFTDSGVSLGKLNNFLSAQNLQKISGFSSQYSTVGGALFVDEVLQGLVEKITIWSGGEVLDTKVLDLNIQTDVILSSVFKVKAEEIPLLT